MSLIVMQLLSLNLYAKSMVYSIEQAIPISIKTHKSIFFIVASNKCPHYVHYIQNTINPNIDRLSNQYVIAIADVADGDSIPEDLPFHSVLPSTYIIGSDGKILAGPLEGDFPEKSLLKLMR